MTAAMSSSEAMLDGRESVRWSYICFLVYNNYYNSFHGFNDYRCQAYGLVVGWRVFLSFFVDWSDV